MTAQHAARPTGEWDADGAGHCATCGGRLIEAIYTGGWMHAQEAPHAFVSFVYGDGTKSETICVMCARPRDDVAIHSGKK